MSPLPFEVLTNGHCQGPKHLAVGDALLRRFGLAYDPEPLLKHIYAVNPETFSLERTKGHRLGLEREFAGLSLVALMWLARNLALHASATRVDADDLSNLLALTSAFDKIHSPYIGTLFPIMTARTSRYQVMIEAGLEEIRLRTSAPDEISMQILSLMRETNTDDGWLEEYEKERRTKVGLARFDRRKRSKAYQMLEENLTIWNYPTTTPVEGVEDRAFSSRVIYTLANGNVFGPKQSRRFLQIVDPPRPLHESKGEVVMLAEDFLELRKGDVLHDLISSNKALTKLHLIVGDEAEEGMEEAMKCSDAQARMLVPRLTVSYVGWPESQAMTPVTSRP